MADYCPTCNAEIEADDARCPGCGAAAGEQLAEEAGAPAPAPTPEPAAAPVAPAGQPPSALTVEIDLNKQYNFEPDVAWKHQLDFRLTNNAAQRFESLRLRLTSTLFKDGGQLEKQIDALEPGEPRQEKFEFQPTAPGEEHLGLQLAYVADGKETYLTLPGDILSIFINRFGAEFSDDRPVSIVIQDCNASDLSLDLGKLKASGDAADEAGGTGRLWHALACVPDPKGTAAWAVAAAPAEPEESAAEPEVAAPAPEPAAIQRPSWLAPAIIIAAAVLIVGGILLLSHRETPRPTRPVMERPSGGAETPTPPDTPVVKKPPIAPVKPPITPTKPPVPPPVKTPVKLPAPPPATPSTKNVAQVQALAQATPNRKVQVSLRTRSGKTAFVEGDELVYDLSVAKDSYVAILCHQVDGTTVVLFPNAHNRDALVRAGDRVVIPGQQKAGFKIVVGPPFGADVVQAIACTDENGFHKRLVEFYQTSNRVVYHGMTRGMLVEGVKEAFAASAKAEWGEASLVIKTKAR